MLSPLFLLIDSRYRHSTHNRGKSLVCALWKPKAPPPRLKEHLAPYLTSLRGLRRSSPITLTTSDFTGEPRTPGDSENEVMWRRSVIVWILLITLNGQLWVTFLDFFQQLLDSRVRFIYPQPGGAVGVKRRFLVVSRRLIPNAQEPASVTL